MKKLRVFFTGVGGQGTLTATRLLAQAAMDKGLPVVSGEIHGMAQRGGVVESTVLIGGYNSPKISPGEADLLLGFEPLETLRALPYLKPGGVVISSVDPIYPPGVSKGLETYPDLEGLKTKVRACAGRTIFLSIKDLGSKAGALQSGNVALLGAACASRLMPMTLDDLIQTIKTSLPAKIVEVNTKAARLGAEAI